MKKTIWNYVLFGIAETAILAGLCYVFGSVNPSHYLTALGVGAALFGYLLNAEKERSARSFGQRKSDYAEFITLWAKANLEDQSKDDPLAQARIKLLLFSSKEVVLGLKNLIKAEVKNPEIKAPALGYGEEIRDLINQMRKDCEQEQLTLDDVFWVIQKVGAPSLPTKTDG